MESLVAGRVAPHLIGHAPLAADIKRHGLEGLVVIQIEEGRLELQVDTEEAIRESWKQRLRKSAMVDLEVRRIARASSKAAVLPTPIMLKGEAVASKYANPSARTYGDFDFLVPRHAAADWGSFLRTLGYVPESKWREGHQAMYGNHVEYVRRLSGGQLLSELHTRLCTHRSLMDLSYDKFKDTTEPGPAHGLLQLSRPAQLIALAVHLFHHAKSERRLIWYRDFLELGDGDCIRVARELASEWRVGWVLEWALGDVERVAGKPVWRARRVRLPDKGLWRVLERDKKGLSLHLALARELTPFMGFRYLISKFNPRRFLDDNGRFQWSELKAWSFRMGKSLPLQRFRL